MLKVVECPFTNYCDNYQIECYHCTKNYEPMRNYHVFNHCGVPGLLCEDCNPKDCSYRKGVKKYEI